MDMLSNTKLQPKNWPNAPAVRGQTYSVNDPVFQKDQLVIMLWDTWLDHGTVHEALKRKVEQQDKTLLQLKAMNDVLVAQLAALQEKHTNLREATRKERTAKALKSSNLKAK